MKTLKYHGNKTATTLLETLIVLGIATSLLIMTCHIGWHQEGKLEERLFISSYRRQLKLLQLRSMNDQASTIFYNYPQKSYEVKASPFQAVIMKIPATMESWPTANLMYSGGWTKAKGVQFKSDDTIYQFIFQIGKGQYRYIETKLHSD